MFHWFDTVRHGLAGLASSSRRTRQAHKRSHGRHVAASASSRYSHHALVEPLERRNLLAVGVPELVYDVSPGAANSVISLIGNLNGEVLFSESVTDGLWKSNGASSGTTLLKDFAVIGVDAGVIGGTLYFEAWDGASSYPYGPDNRENKGIWKSDGTSSGTVFLHTIDPDLAGPGTQTHLNFATCLGGDLIVVNSSGPGPLIPYNSLLKISGTTGAVTNVKTFSGGYLGTPVTVGGAIFFSVEDQSVVPAVNQLWKSDGTSAGTVLVKDFGDDSNSNIGVLANGNGTLFFVANDGVSGTELWKSNGTSSGTVLIKDIRSGAAGSIFAYSTSSLINILGTLYFQANDGVNGYELWKSTGTSNGTVMVRNINSGASHSNASPQAVLNNKLYFTATNGGTGGNELWTTSGSSAGTVIVRDIASGAASSDSLQFTSANGRMFFSANTATTGRELWTSNGTSSGTQLVANINPGAASGFVTSTGTALTSLAIGDLFYFVANDGVHGNELWKVTNENLPPTAPGAGGPYVRNEGSSLSLAGVASTDPDGDPLTYSWDLNGDNVFGDAFGQTASVSWSSLTSLGISAAGGPYTVRVQVDDGYGHQVVSLPSTLTITNTAPTAFAGGPYVIAPGQSLSLAGSGVDPGGQPVTYSWDVNGDGTFGDALGSFPVLTPTQLAALGIGSTLPSSNLVRVQVTDSLGLSAVSAGTGLLVSPVQTLYKLATPDIHYQVAHTGNLAQVTEHDGPWSARFTDGTAAGTYHAGGATIFNGRIYDVRYVPDPIEENERTFVEVISTDPLNPTAPPVVHWQGYQYNGFTVTLNLFVSDQSLWFLRTEYDDYSGAERYQDVKRFDGATVVQVERLYDFLDTYYQTASLEIREGHPLILSPYREDGPGFHGSFSHLLLPLAVGLASIEYHADWEINAGGYDDLQVDETVDNVATISGVIYTSVATRRDSLYYEFGPYYGRDLRRFDHTLVNHGYLVGGANGYLFYADETGEMQSKRLSDNAIQSLGTLTPAHETQQAVEYNGLLYFWGNDGVNGMELWKSDGTAAGTQLAIEFTPGAAGTTPGLFRVEAGQLLFDANSNVYRSDGTSAGTTSLTQAAPPGFQWSVLGSLNNGVLLTLRGQPNTSSSWPEEQGSGLYFLPNVLGPPPEIAVSFGAVPLTDGDTTPSTTEGSDFGAPAAGVAPLKQWTITNTGPGVLDLSGGVTITGPNASDFSVTTPPAVTTLATGQSTTFRVRFAPIAGGTRTATVVIINNDADESPFDFAITGVGASNLTPAEIDVTVDATSIPDGGTAPAGSGATNWNNVLVGTSVTRTFSVNNSGTAALLLAGVPTVTISGPNAADFSVTTLPGPQIRGLGASVMAIQFSPSAMGLRTATVTIANSDSDENPYDFTISGTGFVPVTATGTGGYRGESRPFVFTINDAGTTAGYRFDIDWNNDAVVDETLTTTSSSVTVPHQFFVSGTQTVRVTVTDLDDNSGGAATLLVTTATYVLRQNAENAALTDLIWGGSDLDDHVLFWQEDTSLIGLQTLMDSGTAVNTTQYISGVTGRVIAYGNPGSDTLDASELFNTQATLDGGAGNNTLRGGAGGDVLIGGTDGAEGSPNGHRDGSNVIIAGNGVNTIYGNAPVGKKEQTGGNNLIIGGTGADTIYGNYGVNNQPLADGGEGGHNLIIGGAGADAIYTTQSADGGEGSHGSIVIAGTTTYGNNSAGIAALQSILAEWSSSHTLAVKQANLSGTNGPVGLNGANYLTAGGTALSDAAIDSLFGDTHGSAHWFFYRLSEDLLSRDKASDIKTALP